MAERVPVTLSELLERSRKRNIGRGARVEESRVVKSLGGRTTPASGARSVKGDGRINGSRGMIFVEHKTTEGGSNPLTLRVIEKAFREARNEGLDDVMLTVTFTAASAGVPRDYVMIPLDAYKALVRDAGENDE